MILAIGLSLLVNLLGVALRVAFYAVSAYWVARCARKGWKAGK